MKRLSFNWLKQKTKEELWWMVISIDYDYSRISIADHETSDDSIVLFLEDKHDFKNTLDECLQLTIPIKEFAKVIGNEKLNSYEGELLHPSKQFIVKPRVQINEPIKWYKEDAGLIEQQWAREALLKAILIQVVESGIRAKAV